MAVSTTSVANVYRLLGVNPPNEATLTRIAAEIDAGRSWTDLRDDIITNQANKTGKTREQILYDVVRGYFLARGAAIATNQETEVQRINRIVSEIFSGERTLSEVRSTIYTLAVQPGAGTTPSPAPPQPPAPPPVPDTPPPVTPPADEVDYAAKVRAYYPWLPSALVTIFADAWAETGDQTLALAELRASAAYDTYFPGIKRSDGTLRMSEQEWFSTREAYTRLFTEFGLNPDVFTSRFTELIEGDVSAAELAGRLGAAYEQIITNIPQVKEFYRSAYGLEMTDQAIFASFLDPDIGDAILNRRISVAQVGGEGLARGFDVSEPFAGRLADAGVDQLAARQFFSTAEGDLPTLDTLAQRFRDPDATFDLEEFAEATVFGDAAQTRRIRRLYAAESSLFTEQTGAIALDEDLAVTGLRVR